MAKLTKLGEYRIGKHFLSALIYDDYTGLSDDEEKALNDWIDKNFDTGCALLFDTDSIDFDNLYWCAVTGLMSETKGIAIFKCG